MNAQHATRPAPLTNVQESNVLQNSLQRAILGVSNKLNEEKPAVQPTSNVSIMKPNTQAANSSLPMLIPRTDLLGGNGLFLAHTFDRSAKTIQFWDMKKGSKPRVVSKAFYDSTLPMVDREQSTKMVQEFSKEFGAKEVVLRSRLVKGSMADKEPDGSISQESLKAWKEETAKRMKAAFQVAFDKLVDELIEAI